MGVPGGPGDHVLLDDHGLGQPGGRSGQGCRWGAGGLTYEAAAQPRLGDGAVVGIAAQVELLIQVQALELALGRGDMGSGSRAGRRLGRGGPGGMELGLT